MKHTALGALVIVVWVQSLASAGTTTRRMVAWLDGFQAGSGASGFGCATFDIDTATNTVNYRVSFGGNPDMEVSSYIHGPADPGEMGPTVHPLAPGNPKIGSWTYDEALEADLLGGRMYVDVHYAAGGDIRGQIGDLVAVIDREQMGIGTGGQGFAVCTIDTAANTLNYYIDYEEPPSGEVVAHFHGNAVHTEDAPILHFLPAGRPKIGTWNYTEFDEGDLLNGLIYIVIHSTDFPSGELRGQVSPAVVVLDGTQETTPSGSPAAGCGICAINKFTNRLGYDVRTVDLVAPESGAHLHGWAPPGMDANVRHTLPAGPRKLDRWQFSNSVEDELLAGEGYFNIHSDTHTGGEIRGQVTFPAKTDVFPDCDAADCCDVDGNTIRDDICTYCKCDAQQICTTFPSVFGDIGGSFGACNVDGFVNIHDRNQALTCFGGSNQCPSINIDLGSAFGACPADGFCNVHDANHTLVIFAGNGTCSCGPQPEAPQPPVIAGRARLLIVPEQRRITAGDAVAVRVHLDSPLSNLQSYQLELEATGGARGGLHLVDITIEPRGDAAFEADTGFRATNRERGQMLHGLESEGVPTTVGAYLATFTFQSCGAASGDYVIDAVRGPGANHSVLVSRYDQQVVIDGSTPAVIRVDPPSARRDKHPQRAGR